MFLIKCNFEVFDPLFLDASEPFFNFICRPFISAESVKIKEFTLDETPTQLTVAWHRQLEKGAKGASKEVKDNVWILGAFPTRSYRMKTKE